MTTPASGEGVTWPTIDGSEVAYVLDRLRSYGNATHSNRNKVLCNLMLRSANVIDALRPQREATVPLTQAEIDSLRMLGDDTETLQGDSCPPRFTPAPTGNDGIGGEVASLPPVGPAPTTPERGLTENDHSRLDCIEERVAHDSVRVEIDHATREWQTHKDRRFLFELVKRLSGLSATPGVDEMKLAAWLCAYSSTFTITPEQFPKVAEELRLGYIHAAKTLIVALPSLTTTGEGKK